MCYDMTLTTRCKYQCVLVGRIRVVQGRVRNLPSVKSKYRNNICAYVSLVTTRAPFSVLLSRDLELCGMQSRAKYARYYIVPVFLFLYISVQIHLLDWKEDR